MAFMLSQLGVVVIQLMCQCFQMKCEIGKVVEILAGYLTPSHIQLVAHIIVLLFTFGTTHMINIIIPVPPSLLVQQHRWGERGHAPGSIHLKGGTTPLT